MGWKDDHLHHFHIYGKEYGIAFAGGLDFEDDSNSVRVDDFEFDAGDKFTYTYNYFEHWILDLRIEAINNDSSVAVPACLSGKHVVYSDEVNECNLLLKIVEMLKHRETQSLDDIRSLIETAIFNRHIINRNLLDTLAH